MQVAVNDRGGEKAQPPSSALLSRDPYMGVSCKTPNLFACDRVGLAVWLRAPARRVDAEIAGRKLALDDPEGSRSSRGGERRMFVGFLKPAGLLQEGPLQVTSDAGRGRWIGRKPVSATVRLWIVRRSGAISTATVDVGLSAGWG